MPRDATGRAEGALEPRSSRTRPGAQREGFPGLDQHAEVRGIAGERLLILRIGFGGLPGIVDASGLPTPAKTRLRTSAETDRTLGAGPGRARRPTRLSCSDNPAGNAGTGAESGHVGGCRSNTERQARRSDSAIAESVQGTHRSSAPGAERTQSAVPCREAISASPSELVPTLPRPGDDWCHGSVGFRGCPLHPRLDRDPTGERLERERPVRLRRPARAAAGSKNHRDAKDVRVQDVAGLLSIVRIDLACRPEQRHRRTGQPRRPGQELRQPVESGGNAVLAARSRDLNPCEEGRALRHARDPRGEIADDLTGGSNARNASKRAEGGLLRRIEHREAALQPAPLAYARVGDEGGGLPALVRQVLRDERDAVG